MEPKRHHNRVATGLAWAAGLVAGLLALTEVFGAAEHAVGRLRRLRRDLEKGLPPGKWDEAILGCSMHAVAAAWGPPPVTTVPRQLQIDENRPAYLLADTWYYPINPPGRIAMALCFVRGIVRRVEVIRSFGQEMPS